MDLISLMATILLTAILTWAVERSGDAVLKIVMEKGKSDRNSHHAKDEKQKSDRTSTHPKQDKNQDS